MYGEAKYDSRLDWKRNASEPLSYCTRSEAVFVVKERFSLSNFSFEFLVSKFIYMVG